MINFETIAKELKEIVLTEYENTTFNIRKDETLVITAADSTIAYRLHKRLKEYSKEFSKEISCHDDEENEFFQIELKIIF